MNEPQAALRWLVARLAANAPVVALIGTRVYEMVAPSNAAYPYVLVTFAGSRNVQAAGADKRILSRPALNVRAYTTGTSYAPADAVASAVDNALEGGSSSITVAGQAYLVQALGLEAHIRNEETEGDVRFPYVGGRYGFFVHPA